MSILPDDPNVRYDIGGWISGPCLSPEQMTGSPSDQRHYEPRNAAELEAEFPGWHVFRDTSQLWYARLLGSSPPVSVGRAEDLLDLRDKLITWKWQHSR